MTSWMQPGFTTGKHIIRYFTKSSRRKKAGEKAGDHDVMCETIIRTINECHWKAFAKIRDRVRVDLMKELFFIFEKNGFKLVKARDVMKESYVDINKIPLVNVSRVPPGKVRKVLKKIWDGAADIVDDKLTYVFEYDVNVKMEDGKVERKTIVRKINFFYVAALTIMRITGNGALFDLLTYHEKIIRMIVAIAEILVSLTEVYFNGDTYIDFEREECEPGDDEYHILNLLTSIRPTQSDTRQEMVKDHILNITIDEYEKLHHRFEEDNEDEEEEEEPKDNERIVDDDDADNTLFASELDGAMQFLSKI